MNTVNLYGAGETDQARGARRTDQTADRQRAVQTPPPGPPQESDAVEFSARGEQLSQLIARAQQSHEVRQERVAPLQFQISSNSYSPSADKIADAIIRDS